MNVLNIINKNNQSVIPNKAVEDILCLHELWLKTKGKKGKQGKIQDAILYRMVIYNTNMKKMIFKNVTICNSDFVSCNMKKMIFKNVTICNSYFLERKIKKMILNDVKM